MGCCSSGFVPNTKPGQGTEALVVAQTLGYDKPSIDAMFKCFKKYDMGGDGSISLDEFVVVSKLEEAETFAKMVFRIFDKDHSGKMDFTEFMCAVWNLCSCDKENLAIFTFNLFDFDESKVLESSEVKFMANLFWDFKPPKNVLIALRHFDENGSGEVDCAEFVHHMTHADVLMMPAFDVQTLLRECTLGRSAWERQTSARRKKFGTKDIFEILKKSSHDTKNMKAACLNHVHSQHAKKGGKAESVPKKLNDKIIKAKEHKHHHHNVSKGESLKDFQKAALHDVESGHGMSGGGTGHSVAHNDIKQRSSILLHKGELVDSHSIDKDKIEDDSFLHHEKSHEKKEHHHRSSAFNRSSAVVAIGDMMHGTAAGLQHDAHEMPAAHTKHKVSKH